MKATKWFSTCTGVVAILFGALLISLCVPGSRRAGQFILAKPTIFSNLDAKTLVGIVLLGIINVSLLRWFLRKAGFGVNLGRSLLAYVVSVGLGILIVFGIQSVATEIVLPAPAFIINSSSGNSQLQRSEMGLLIRSASGRKATAVALGIVLLVMLFLIGGGYAYMDTHSPLLLQFIVVTLGVGIAEESSKLLVGFLAYRFLRPKSQGSARMIFLYFTALAGLAFGTGEAFCYFYQYQQADAGFFSYLVRVAWCVPLHMVWAIISATIFYDKFLSGSTEPKRKPSDMVLVFLLTIAPSAIMHGVYDSFAFRGMKAMWFFGAVSCFIAYAVVFMPKDGLRNVLRRIAIMSLIGAAVFSVPHLLDYARHKTVTEICYQCNGVGSLICPNCDGSGQSFNFHPKRNKSLSIECSACNGTGHVVCNQCKGTGKITHQVTLFGE
jgi:hypothetical protein